MLTILLASAASIALVGPVNTLEVHRRIERTFAGGDQVAGNVDADAGHFIHVVIEQRRIDIVAAVVNPTGQRTTIFDAANGDARPARRARAFLEQHEWR